METFRTAVVPVVSAFGLLASIVLYAAKHPAAGAVSKDPVAWRPRLTLIGWTVVGGYVAFLAIVLVFHVWIVGQRGVVRSAVAGGAFLASTSIVAFVLLSAVERRIGSSRNHRTRSSRRAEDGR